MRKFVLLLLVPFLMVTSMFAFGIEGPATDYEGDDVTVEFVDCDDGTFKFVISNYSDDVICVDYEESFFCALDDELNIIEGTETLIFSEEDVEEFTDVIDSGMYLESEPYYFTGDVEFGGYYISIYIGEGKYTWLTIVSDYYED